MALIPFDEKLGICTSYFHAIDLADSLTNMFKTDAGPIMISGSDVTAGAIKPLKNATMLLADGTDLLIRLRGQLVIPDTTGTDKWPLVILEHGQHRSFTGDKASFNEEVLSYQGYTVLQNYLAGKGIASYSINLLMVNMLSNNESTAFNMAALDSNQRILHFFLHLKLLKIMAGETVDETSSADALPINVFDGTSFVNIKDVLANTGSSSSASLSDIKNKLDGKIDFSKLGIMGHSRGADSVSRIPAYFYKDDTAGSPTYPVNTEVDSRIKILAEQVGKPSQDTIKSILALEPTAIVNAADPTKHGYVIDSTQTLYFLGVGTDDEDVTLDAVRMYENPTCSKVMIAINGASHKRFNKAWAEDKVIINGKVVSEFEGMPDPPGLLLKEQHLTILQYVYGPCFTSTLTANSNDLKYFTKEVTFPLELIGQVEIQSAWKFGFPFQTTSGPLDDIKDASVAGLPSQLLASPPFKQEINAYYIEKDDDATDTAKISVTPGSTEDLSKYTNFSFRFAKAFDMSSNIDRPIKKNFSIQLFAGDTPVGKPIPGSNLDKLILKALNAYHFNAAQQRELKYYILLQTAEIFLGSYSQADLTSITRIEISVGDEGTPSRKGHIFWWSLGATALGALIGGGVMILINGDDDVDKLKKDEASILVAAGVGAILIGGITLIYEITLPTFKNGFAFKDFLLTNRTIPAPTTLA